MALELQTKECLNLKKGVKGFKVIISDKSEGIKSFISNLKTLIISIPQKKFKSNNYSKAIKKIIEALDSSTIKRIIFFSSSSIYGSKEGFYDESSRPSPETVSQRTSIKRGVNQEAKYFFNNNSKRRSYRRG